LFVIALRKASEANNMSTEGIIDAFETFKDVDFGIGKKITLNKNEHSTPHDISNVN
jgi:branched-chain amino acid transport system substrate-binding protein